MELWLWIRYFTLGIVLTMASTTATVELAQYLRYNEMLSGRPSELLPQLLFYVRSDDYLNFAKFSVFF